MSREARSRGGARGGRRDQSDGASCGAPEHPIDDEPAYAYLLGLYLGDGCLAPASRTTAPKITLDLAYPGIIDEACQAIRAVRGHGPVHRHLRADANCVCLTSYTRAWMCLFPQHGPGRKHERKIILEPWQKQIADAHAGALLRGLIHSDGWRGDNKVVAKGKEYQYPRYQFSNRSDDIRRIFTDACDVLDIAWRPWGRWHVSVARRDAVTRLDEQVGPKA